MAEGFLTRMRRESLLATDILMLFEQHLPEGTLIDLESGEFTPEGDELFYKVYTEIVAYSLDIELK